MVMTHVTGSSDRICDREGAISSCHDWLYNVPFLTVAAR